MVAEVVARSSESDEVAWDQLRALVNQLVEGVLAVRARLTPDDLSGFELDRLTLAIYRLAVALHSQLLKVRSEP
jgi:hypothetical protein